MDAGGDLAAGDRVAAGVDELHLDPEGHLDRVAPGERPALDDALDDAPGLFGLEVLVGTVSGFGDANFDGGDVRDRAVQQEALFCVAEPVIVRKSISLVMLSSKVGAGRVDASSGALRLEWVGAFRLEPRPPTRGAEMISKQIHTNPVDRRPGRRRRRLAPVVALILAVVLLHGLPTAVKATASQAGVELSRPDGPESGNGRNGSSLPKEQFRETIEAAYEKLEIYTASSGAGLEFELTDFMTYTRNDFSGVPLTDVATMPGGRVLDVVRNTRTHSDVDAGTERVTVQYSPRWRTKELTWRLLPEASRAADVTLAEAMSSRAREDPAFRYVEAATSYDVTVSFEGESRAYRAAFLWFNQDPRSGWATFDLLALDHISQGVGKALRETVPVEGLEYSLPESRRESDGEPSLHSKATCADTVVASDSFSNGGGATNEHLTGKHYASASFDFDCGCSSDCSQTCNARPARAAVVRVGQDPSSSRLRGAEDHRQH